MSRSSAAKGSLSTFSITDRDSCESALKCVYEGSSDWAILAYVKGKKDEVELVTTGSSGIEGLKQHFPSDRIFYGLLCIKLKTSAGPDYIKKFILVTMIGQDVPPLQKARSSAQRKDISDFILSACALNVHFQPNDKSEMTIEVLYKMFQSPEGVN